MKKIIATVLAMVMALALCTTAFAAPTPTLEDQWIKGTEKDAVAEQADVYFVKAAEPTTNNDDKVTEKGHVAYYIVDNKTYVSVGSKAEADIVVYSDEECKNAVLFLADVIPEYYVAAVTTNFGKNCGQIVKPASYDKNNTYYLVTGLEGGDDLLYVADDDNGDESVMVSGKLVKVRMVDEATYVQHNQTPVVKDGKLVGYKCATCGIDAIKAANWASIPSDAAMSFQGSDSNWYYFPAKAVSGTTTGTTTSPKTFDAGIAMYVGMALTSVAGSAVVIGKKKEF